MRKSRSSASSLATGVPSQAREEQLLKRIGKLESAIESLKARNVQAATSPEVVSTLNTQSIAIKLEQD